MALILPGLLERSGIGPKLLESTLLHPAAKGVRQKEFGKERDKNTSVRISEQKASKKGPLGTKRLPTQLLLQTNFFG